MLDVIIIGGGLAGLATGTLLARSGRSVVLFEANHYPYHKVCGEYISMESWPFLERLGIPLSTMNLPRITEFMLSAPSGRSFSATLPLGGFGISRFTLDHLLSVQAREAGVTLLEGTRGESATFRDDHFEVIAGGKTWKARLVLGCWGRRSSLDRNLNRDFFMRPDPALSDWVGIKYHVESDFPDNRIELHNFQNGYCGISRVDLQRTTLCYLVRGSTLREVGGAVPDLESRIVRKNPFLDRYLRSYPSLYDHPKAISQVNFQPRPAIENHILMVGDSGGVIPPLTGNGMSIALRGASVLHQPILDFLNGTRTREELESIWVHEWKTHFAGRLKTGRLIQRFFGHPVQSELLVWLASLVPGTAAQLIRRTHGNPF